MLKLCTSSWNVSGRQPLLPPPKGADWWPGCLFFVDAVFMSWFLFCNVCVPLKADPLNCTFPQPQKAWAHCISLTFHSLHRQDGRAQFKRYKSLKKEKKKNTNKTNKKKKPEENRKKATFQDSQSCSTQAKITNACFCNCLDPSSDPIAEDLPASWTDWRTLTLKGLSHAAPASRGSPLYSSLLHDSIGIHHKHVDIYCDYGGWCRLFLDRNLRKLRFCLLIQQKEGKKKSNMFFFFLC